VKKAPPGLGVADFSGTHASNSCHAASGNARLCAKVWARTPGPFFFQKVALYFFFSSVLSIILSTLPARNYRWSPPIDLRLRTCSVKPIRLTVHSPAHCLRYCFMHYLHWHLGHCDMLWLCSSFAGENLLQSRELFPGEVCSACCSNLDWKATSNSRIQDNSLLVEWHIKCNLSRRRIRVEDISCAIS